ncbi:hypothetical protein KAR91_78265 [Candidatus Pacearchaeota archaeon]|nr:hypothetical protein [Candidatus Pacearchaeota archaeon]
MDLEEQIRQINNPQEFVKICNTIFTEMYRDDFQVIEGTRSDQGNDGYITSEKRILAIYCPVKPENRTDRDYRRKINSDLEKAEQLKESGKLEIKKWTFITPGKLSNNVILHLKNKAKEFNFEGNHLEATFLANELYRNRHLLEKFPSLHIPTIESKLDEILKELKKNHKEEITVPVDKKIYEKKVSKYERSEDLKKVFEILGKEQTETSKTELKSIFYKTTDKIAQVNAILGLLNWYDPLENRNSDMIEWCNEGIRLSDMLENKTLRAIFLASKGVYLSGMWSKEDMETASIIRAGNMIGLQVISEEQRQEKIKELHQLEEQFTNAFKEAMEIAIELKNANVLAQVCLNIGQAAGERFIHLNALGVKNQADREKVLSKRMLLHAKELYSAIGYELGVGYALHNLANQLCAFREKEEALKLNKIVIEIAKKYNDVSLLQTANWLKETLTTGKIPDYVHGEKRERKK